MLYENFQDGRSGGILGYRNGTILAILIFHVSPMPLTKFRSNPTYRRLNILKMAAIMDIGKERFFSNSESLRRPKAFHKVWAQSN